MSMRSGPGMNAEDQQMFSQFNQQQHQQQGPAFQFDAMRHEVNNLQQVPGGGPGGGGAWAQDFKAAGPGPQLHTPPPPAAAQMHAPQGQSSQWSAEFHQPTTAAPMGSSGATPMTSGYAPFMSRFTPQMQMTSGPMHMQHQQQHQPQQGRIQQLDDKNWEEQFRQIEEAHAKEAEAKDKGKAKESADQEATTSETVVDENGEEFHVEYSQENFENVWEKIKSQVLDNEEWLSKEAWDRDFDEFTTGRPEFGDYQFEENNPYMEQDDPYTMGVSLMDTGAKLSVAALCFEAAVQKDPNHVDAWARLGAAQAQNEKEDPAIRALERCIKLDPGNLGALMNLSVSYTNEGCENAAYATLEKWLATKYPHIADKARTQEPRLDNEGRFQLHSRVTELFIRAAQMSPDGANMDADVQVGLGVLFYGNEEYSKAIDCFNAALGVRPNDPLLWNRLGATLANSNRSEEAIDAYYRALELRPSFVRARYNLGVSCINIGCYREAAQHLLAALSLHKTDGPEDDVLANQSTNLYETLRRVFLAMERRDLVEKVGNGMDVNEFRNEFEF